MSTENMKLQLFLPDDSAMPARKAEWKKIVLSLREMKSDVDVKAHKYHKELFFEGHINSDIYSKEPAIYSKMLRVKVFSDVLLFLKCGITPIHPKSSFVRWCLRMHINFNEIESVRLRE